MAVNKTEYLARASSDQYMTVDEASQELGVKPPVLRNYLYQGKFTTYKFKTLTLLRKQEVLNRKNSKPK